MDMSMQISIFPQHHYREGSGLGDREREISEKLTPVLTVWFGRQATKEEESKWYDTIRCKGETNTVLGKEGLGHGPGAPTWSGWSMEDLSEEVRSEIKQRL